MNQSSDRPNQEVVHTNPYEGLTPLDESVPLNYAYGSKDDTKENEEKK